MSMKDIVKVKNAIIIMLCVTIILLGIGFSYISMQLDSYNKNKSSYGVAITSVEQQSSIKGSYKNPTSTYNLSNNSQTINFSFNLFAPKDEISYKITIENIGTLNAEITNLIEIPDYINDAESAQEIYPVKVTHNDIIGKTIKPKEKIELNVVVYFNQKQKAQSIKLPYQISVLSTMKD